MNTVFYANETTKERRIINRAAVKAHALKVSRTLRGGKFTRVGEAFQEEVEVDAEALIREVRSKFATGLHDPLLPEEGVHFATGDLMDALKRELDLALARLIQNKVQRHPSVGCTLQNTR